MEVRLARPSDTAAIAALDVRSWLAAYAQLMPAEYLQARSVNEQFAVLTAGIERGRVLVAIESHTVVGYATVGSDHEARTGALHMLYVDPVAWGTGVGDRLEASARGLLQELGHGEATLWVLERNERARRFYLRRRWVDEGTHRLLDYGAASLVALRMRTDLWQDGHN